jgi:hypothetical protein
VIYFDHCFRSGAKLLQEAYEGELVRIDGSTFPTAPPDGQPFQVIPCLDAPRVTIGNMNYAYYDYGGPAAMIEGILVQEGSEYRVEPRQASDVYEDNSTDTCL